MKMVTFCKEIGIDSINKKNLITMKKLLLILTVVGYALSLSSCASTEQCWAYRDVSKYRYNNNKNRPSVAISKGKKRMRIPY